MSGKRDHFSNFPDGEKASFPAQMDTIKCGRVLCVETEIVESFSREREGEEDEEDVDCAELVWAQK